MSTRGRRARKTTRASSRKADEVVDFLSTTPRRSSSSGRTHEAEGGGLAALFGRLPHFFGRLQSSFGRLKSRQTRYRTVRTVRTVARPQLICARFAACHEQSNATAPSSAPHPGQDDKDDLARDLGRQGRPFPGFRTTRTTRTTLPGVKDELGRGCTQPPAKQQTPDGAVLSRRPSRQTTSKDERTRFDCASSPTL
jgi:hypothetical protein